MISAILLECSFTTLIVFVVVLMVAWYSKYSLISLTFIAISRCINVSPVSAEPSITKMSIASSNLENSKTDNSSNLCNAASNHSFGIFSKTICNSDEQGILLLPSTVISYPIFVSSVDRFTNDSIPLTSIAAASFITSYTGGLPLPLWPLFDVLLKYGAPNSLATLSANSILSRKVISTLSILPLNGLLVLIDHGRFFSGLSEYLGLHPKKWTGS